MERKPVGSVDDGDLALQTNKVPQMITINNFSMVGVLSNGERCKHFQFKSQLLMFVFVHVKFSTYIQKLYHLGSGLAYFPFINLNCTFMTSMFT